MLQAVSDFQFFFIMEVTEVELPQLEAEWLVGLRRFLHDIGGSIELDNTCIVPKQRENNDYIMDIVMATGFTDAQIRKVNYCRMYLGVLLVSDITTCNGDSINPDMYHGKEPQGTRTKHTVNQDCTSEKAWAQWRRFIHIQLVQLEIKDASGSMAGEMG
jgi:hypothetical protein